MTGLDIDSDELVEIAVVITDYDLNIIDPGLDLIIKPNPASLENMNDFVRNMHETSGLINEIPDGISATEAETLVLEYVLKFIPADQNAPLAGNSIGTDRAFLTKYMPRLDNQLHYRNVDVSSIKELARRWYPRVYFNAPAKDGGHRALADILESIRELAYYRQTVFVADPGPSSEQAKTSAAQAVNNFAPNM